MSVSTFNGRTSLILFSCLTSLLQYCFFTLPKVVRWFNNFPSLHCPNRRQKVGIDSCTRCHCDYHYKWRKRHCRSLGLCSPTLPYIDSCPFHALFVTSLPSRSHEGAGANSASELEVVETTMVRVGPLRCAWRTLRLEAHLPQFRNVVPQQPQRIFGARWRGHW